MSLPPIIVFELQIGERHSTFWKRMLLLNTFTIRTMQLFLPVQKTWNQHDIQSKWAKMEVLGTSPVAMFPYINKFKSISDYFQLIHNSWRFKLKNWYKSNKTKSVSTFTTSNSLNQLFEAPRAWKSKHVSVYLWLQGWSACKWEYKLSERTSSKWDVMISTIFAKFYLCWYLASWKALSCYHYSLKIFETFLQLEVPSLLLSLQKSRFPLSFAL